jgi:hypothetical protein
MEDFREKIMYIAERRKEIRDKTLISREGNSSGSNLKEVMNILYGKTELGVNIYNEAIKGGELSIFKLPEELLQVFLNFPGKQIGFCLMSDLKIVLVIGELPDEVIVLGKKRQSYGSREPFLTRAVQLIRIKFEHSGNIYSYEDNTGSFIAPDELIVHIINWAVT